MDVKGFLFYQDLPFLPSKSNECQCGPLLMGALAHPFLEPSNQLRAHFVTSNRAQRNVHSNVGP